MKFWDFPLPLNLHSCSVIVPDLHDTHPHTESCTQHKQSGRDGPRRCCVVARHFLEIKSWNLVRKLTTLRPWYCFERRGYSDVRLWETERGWANQCVQLYTEIRFIVFIMPQTTTIDANKVKKQYFNFLNFNFNNNIQCCYEWMNKEINYTTWLKLNNKLKKKIRLLAFTLQTKHTWMLTHLFSVWLLS